MEVFDNLSNIEKYGLLLEFVSQTTPDINLIIKYYKKHDMISIEYDHYADSFTGRNADTFSSECAGKYVSKVIVDEFNAYHRDDQFIYLCTYFYTQNSLDSMYYCYKCQEVSFAWHHNNKYVGCKVEECQVEYCRECYDNKHMSTGLCHTHDTLFAMLYKKLQKEDVSHKKKPNSMRWNSNYFLMKRKLV